MMFRISLGLSALLLAGAAFAHQTLATENWCANGVVEPVAEFTFTAAELGAYKTCLHGGRCAPGMSPANNFDLRTCGQFDDDWGVTKRMAVSHCAAYSTTSKDGSDFGTVVAEVAGPASFNGADHHKHYSINEGVSGMCGRCVPHKATDRAR